MVEDTESNRTVLTTILALNNYETIAVTNGQEALDWTQTNRPDLVLLDIQMPGIDGCTVARIFRQSPYLQTIPIIALTALALDKEREQILAAGCNAYLLKPIAMQTLLNAIQDGLALARFEEKL